jgi:hypothetical protein
MNVLRFPDSSLIASRCCNADNGLAPSPPLRSRSTCACIFVKLRSNPSTSPKGQSDRPEHLQDVRSQRFVVVVGRHIKSRRAVCRFRGVVRSEVRQTSVPVFGSSSQLDFASDVRHNAANSSVRTRCSRPARWRATCEQTHDCEAGAEPLRKVNLPSPAKCSGRPSALRRLLSASMIPTSSLVPPDCLEVPKDGRNNCILPSVLPE